MADASPRRVKARRVAIAIDSSEPSMAAVKWAASFIVQPEDTVVLLTVQAQPDLSGGLLPMKDDEPLSKDAIESIRTHISQFSRHILEKARKILEEDQITKVETVAEIGDAREKICEYVGAHGIDMLVIGSRGLGALTRQLLGSVSSYCVHNAKVPVVVVRNPSSA